MPMMRSGVMLINGHVILCYMMLICNDIVLNFKFFNVLKMPLNPNQPIAGKVFCGRERFCRTCDMAVTFYVA